MKDKKLNNNSLISKLLFIKSSNKYFKIFITTIIVYSLLTILEFQKSFLWIYSYKNFAVMKFLGFIFMYCFIYILFFIFEHRKSQRSKHGFVIFSVYFVVLMVILLSIWPGAWSWDDLFILIDVKMYDVLPWQHFLSAFFQNMCAQILPFASGILIMQVIIAGMIVAYCISGISDILAKNNRQKIIYEILLFVPTILPPLILYILSGFRMGIYSYFELLLIVKLFLIYKSNKKISNQDLFIITILVILVASWRTEAIYYLFCIPIILLIIGKKYISLKAVTIVFIISSVMTIGIGKFNNYLIGNNDYSITAIIEPLQAMIKVSDPVKDGEELKKIDKVLYLNMIYEHPNMQGSGYYWNGIVRSEYTSKDYKNFLVSYIKLLIKYPNVAFKSMWNIFINTSGIKIYKNGQTAQVGLINGTLNLFNESTSYGKKWIEVGKTPFKTPININIRDKMIRALGCIDENSKVNWLYYIFWNLFIPIILAIFSLIYNFIKRNYFLNLLIIVVLIRIPLVFATSTTAYIMYYLSVYLLCYFLTFVSLISTCKIGGGKKKHYKKYLKKEVVL